MKYIIEPDDIKEMKWASLNSALQEAKLLPNPDGTAFELNRFGFAVSMSVNRALIGTKGDDEMGYDSGTAYVFEFDGVT